MIVMTPYAPSIPVFESKGVEEKIRMAGTCIRVDGKLVVRSAYDARHLTFLKSLPESRFYKVISGWKCMATPLAAQMCRSVGLSLDGPSVALADAWLAGQEPMDLSSIEAILHTFKTKPWLHQQRAMAYSFNRPSSLLNLGMGCIAGDMVVSANKAGNTIKMPIKELHRLFNSEKRTAKYSCRCLKGDTFGLNEIRDVVYSGKKPTITLTMDNGKFITCTTDHMLAIPSGDGFSWMSAGSLSVGHELLTNGKPVAKDACVGCEKAIYVSATRKKERSVFRCGECAAKARSGDGNPAWKGGRYIDKDGHVRVMMPNHHRAWKMGYVYEHILVMEEKLELLTPSEHNKKHNRERNLHGGATINGGVVVYVPKIAKIVRIEESGVQDTYDIVMADPHRNFVANGVVVHNCGKTLATICLLQAWKAKKTLILCPKSVTGVWSREFRKHCGVLYGVTILEGSTKEKVGMFKQASLRFLANDINAVVINYESSWREGIDELLQETEWDCVVADESHRIKTMDSNQSKFAATLAENSKRRLGLTGTALPNGEPIEIMGQYRFLEPALFGTSIGRFRDKYCNMNYSIPGKVDSYKNQDHFTEKFAKIAFRVKSEDVLTLPDCVHVTIPVTLDKKTRAFYETMKKESLLELEGGDVTAVNAAIKVMRLHQIACGHSKTEDKTVIRLGKDKYDVLLDMIEDISKDDPVVVFCKFIEDLRQIEEIAKKLGRRYGEISGARKDLTPDATMPDWVQVMGVQQQAGGTGIDLTRSHYAFWFSVGASWGEFDQTNARVHRPGQSHPVTIYHLAAVNTVDIRIYRSLRNKQDVGLEILKAIDHKDETNEMHD